jgi:hypothetical protein
VRGKKQAALLVWVSCGLAALQPPQKTYITLVTDILHLYSFFARKKYFFEKKFTIRLFFSFQFSNEDSEN